MPCVRSAAGALVQVRVASPFFELPFTEGSQATPQVFLVKTFDRVRG
jgi:hypothetical protein